MPTPPRIFAVIGARPQFIKHAPVELALRGRAHLITAHTGQHYDENMSQVFFRDLSMAAPDHMLAVGSGAHGAQTGQMMAALEPLMQEAQPQAALVYGDTNSTLAGALVAAKLGLPVIHIEAGLRSYNRTMPEEINRVLTDHVSDLLLVPTEAGIHNLAAEGIRRGVQRCGDVMCDMLRIAQAQGILAQPPRQGPYAFATIHRPYNTDSPHRLRQVLAALDGLPIPAAFAVHPRTRSRMAAWGWQDAQFPNITFLPPVGYFDSLRLQAHAQVVITDSGGVQKEAYMLAKQCITLRPETEWVETLQGGWNTLCFDDLGQLPYLLRRTPTTPHDPHRYGDGRAAHHIAHAILAFLEAPQG